MCRIWFILSADHNLYTWPATYTLVRCKGRMKISAGAFKTCIMSCYTYKVVVFKETVLSMLYGNGLTNISLIRLKRRLDTLQIIRYGQLWPEPRDSPNSYKYWIEHQVMNLPAAKLTWKYRTVYLILVSNKTQNRIQPPLVYDEAESANHTVTVS